MKRSAPGTSLIETIQPICALQEFSGLRELAGGIAVAEGEIEFALLDPEVWRRCRERKAQRSEHPDAAFEAVWPG